MVREFSIFFISRSWCGSTGIHMGSHSLLLHRASVGLICCMCTKRELGCLFIQQASKRLSRRVSLLPDCLPSGSAAGVLYSIYLYHFGFLCWDIWALFWKHLFFWFFFLSVCGGDTIGFNIISIVIIIVQQSQVGSVWLGFLFF